MAIKETGENQDRQRRKRQRQGENRGDCVWESQEMKGLRGGRGSTHGVKRSAWVSKARTRLSCPLTVTWDGKRRKTSTFSIKLNQKKCIRSSFVFH